MSNFSALKFELRWENKIEIVDELLRTILGTLHSLPKLLVSAEYAVKTVPDKSTHWKCVAQRSHNDKFTK